MARCLFRVRAPQPYAAVVLHDTGLHAQRMTNVRYSSGRRAKDLQYSRAQDDSDGGGASGTGAGGAPRGAAGSEPHAASLGWVHQPVERLVADWIVREYKSAGWQRISIHDDTRDSCVETRTGDGGEAAGDAGGGAATAAPPQPARLKAHASGYSHLLADGCVRHGMTIMQRKVSLRVPKRVCQAVAGATEALCSEYRIL